MGHFKKFIGFPRNPIGAQFTPYPALKTSILNWRNETLPPLPAHISQVAEALRNPKWQRELKYEILSADRETGDVESSEHTIKAWTVEGNNESHVVFGSRKYVDKFKDLDVAYIDATYDSVPKVDGAYQLLTMMVEYCGQVNHKKNADI